MNIDDFVKKISKVQSTPFKFNGKEITLNEMRNCEKVKAYTESSHFDRKLLRHIETNELFLYEFYEYGFEDEKIYTTYVLVKDESDADRLNKERDIRRSPYFRVMPDWEIVSQ